MNRSLHAPLVSLCIAARLTKRETETLVWSAAGADISVIACGYGRSEDVVRCHASRGRRKILNHCQKEAVNEALNDYIRGLRELEEKEKLTEW